jgi:hypothetical protein
MTMEQPRQTPEQKEAEVIAFKEIQAKARRAARPKLDPEEERRRSRANVAALIFAGILIVIGWLLVQKLGASGRMEDCLMSGRTNCAPIKVGPAEN